jgi:hypothetical protein
MKHASAGFSLLNFAQSRDKLSSADFSRSAPGASFARLLRFAESAAAGGKPGAFRNGTVKNHQRSATEALKMWQISNPTPSPASCKNLRLR